MSYVLITGAAGFIGSHTCVVLLQSGFKIIMLDNFSNSSPLVVNAIQSLSGLTEENFKKRVSLIKGDITDKDLLDKIFSLHRENGEQITSVIHFAGLKSVRESINEPLLYWEINVSGTRILLEIMNKYDCKTIVFSSSATVYGNTKYHPIKEDSEIKPINPYGKTKAAIEMLLSDISGCRSNQSPLITNTKDWKIAILRYFNPVGAHESGLIGENPTGIPNNIFPLITQVALGNISSLKIYGNDWPTKDGTGIRDYIHVVDIAEGHKAALQLLLEKGSSLITLNLGSGKGYSVLDLINCFEKVSEKKIRYEIVDRREGDSAISIADSSAAKNILKWSSKRSLEDICRDGWNWQRKHPKGY